AVIVGSEEVVPALEAAYRAFGSTVKLAEGAAAVVLTTEQTDVELTRIELSARPATTLRYANMPLNFEQGLIQLARAVEKVRGGAERAHLVTYAQGGGEGTIELQRTPSPREGRGPG